MDQVPGSPQQPQGASGLSACYRHPDRETGVKCTRCERPICPECMISASVGFQCPNCVREGSGTGHAPTANRPRTITGGTIAADPRLVTKILIGLNIAVFIVGLANKELLRDLMMLGDTPPQYLPEGVANGEWWRLFTAMFAHQEIWHIGFNMLGLWWLGGPLEAHFGRVRYLALYLLSGLAGSALTYVTEPYTFSLGASGAVFGLMGATAVLMRRLNYDMRPVIALLAINMLFTFTMNGIAWQAHVGGLVAGAAIAYGMVHAPREHRALVQWGTCAAVFVLTLITVMVETSRLT
ncbi:rhomboid family intramembrane serine protease [Streptomyces sp. NPDC050418]|uniref:rhomboid family intramembrane serine protease n=1 Tax=Streptomyces sp. NPDC050418 TaxID=3365612 RepID=UPI0037BC4BD4